MPIEILQGLAIPFLGTTLGAACVFLLRGELDHEPTTTLERDAHDDAAPFLRHLERSVPGPRLHRSHRWHPLLSRAVTSIVDRQAAVRCAAQQRGAIGPVRNGCRRTF